MNILCSLAFDSFYIPVFSTLIKHGNRVQDALVYALCGYKYVLRYSLQNVLYCKHSIRQTIVGMLLTFISLSIVGKNYSSVSLSFSNTIQSRNQVHTSLSKILIALLTSGS